VLRAGGAAALGSASRSCCSVKEVRLAGNSTGIGLGWRIFGFVLRCLYLALRIHLRNKKARLYSVQFIEFRTHLSKSRINDS
jgi:hypothetical protein